MEPECLFISGHMDLTKEEFAARYEPAIRAAHAAGAHFVVGDAHGCDFMAQRLLAALETGQPKDAARVRVFHMLERPRHSFGSGCGSNDPSLPKEAWAGCRGGFPLVGGFTSDAERDAAMTAASTGDIAWVRPDKSKKNSGTAKNIERRASARDSALREAMATWPRRIVENDWSDDGPFLRLHEPTEREPGTPIDPALLTRLARAREAAAAADAELSRCFAALRTAVSEHQRLGGVP